MLTNLLALDVATVHRTWFLVPLVVVVSLVYSASRYEMPDRILRRAARLSLTILGFMAAVFAVLVLLSWGLCGARVQHHVTFSFSAVIALVLLTALMISGCEKKPSPSAKPVSPVTTKKPGVKTEPQSAPPIFEVEATPQQTIIAVAPPAPTEQPQPVFRPSDERPKHDDEKLVKAGIHKFVSKRLILYTDIGADHARSLPPIMDRAFDAWEEYFGPLPHNRERTEFQMTGYLMADRAKFVETGLLPDDLPGFLNGRHRGQQFWMNDQSDDYYRRHLMIHEGTHCFMTIVPNVMERLVWYMEGMAEHFGTHAIDAAGRVRFRVFPDDKSNYPGLGRIRMIHDEIAKGTLHDLDGVLGLKSNEFLRNEPYAWSWALCCFLDSHPRYRDRFRRVNEHVTVERAMADFRKLFAADWQNLADEWLLFSVNICEGYDMERAIIDFQPGRSLDERASATVEVAADRGWQASGVKVIAGQTCHVTATGRFVVAKEPKPWDSEPQGVSIRYVHGHPPGMLAGVIRAETPAKTPADNSLLKPIFIGREKTFTAPVAGTLYFRVNEFWNELADNTGSVRVVVEVQ